MLETIWGPLTGTAKLARRSVKLAFCLVIAVFLHETAFGFLTMPSLPEKAGFDETGNLELPDELHNVTVKLCGVSERTSGPCSEPSHLLGVFLEVEGANGEKGDGRSLPILAQHAELFAFAPRVTIRHSVHTLARVYERRAFNDPGEGATGLKLCTGTLKRLSSDNCEKSALLEKSLEDSLGDTILGLRLGTLLLGPIQLFTLTVFVFVVLEALGRRARWALQEPQLTTQTSTDESNVRTWHLKTGDALEAAIRRYADNPVKAIQDRLVARAILATSDHRYETPEGGITTLEGYREFLVSEAEAKLDSLGTMNEIMLKLAFAGTVIGIAFALFSARALDAADPITEMLAKAAMFGEIGSAFGTTLLGVVLSIAASGLIQFAYSSWLDTIASAFEAVLSIRDEIEPSLLLEHSGELAPHGGWEGSKTDFVQAVGWLAIFAVFVFGLIALWIYWDEIGGAWIWLSGLPASYF